MLKAITLEGKMSASRLLEEMQLLVKKANNKYNG